MKKYKIKIRFNTECNDGINYWRAIINDVEHIVSNIRINVKSKTTKDYLPDRVAFKWHITCESDDIKFENNELFIN